MIMEGVSTLYTDCHGRKGAVLIYRPRGPARLLLVLPLYFVFLLAWFCISSGMVLYFLWHGFVFLLAWLCISSSMILKDFLHGFVFLPACFFRGFFFFSVVFNISSFIVFDFFPHEVAFLNM